MDSRDLSMEVALVQLPLWDVSCPPLGIAYLKATLESQGIPASCHDLNIGCYHHLVAIRPALAARLWGDSGAVYWTTPFLAQRVYAHLKPAVAPCVETIVKVKPQVLGVNISRASEYFARHFLQELRALCPGSFIVGGGALSLEKQKRAALFEEGILDAWVVGEGESVLPALVSAYEKKGDVSQVSGVLTLENSADFERAKPILDLDQLSIPDFSDFPLEWYAKPGTCPLLMSRGCPGKCSFCFDSRSSPRFRTRSATNVLQEMRSRADLGFDHIEFSDLVMNGNPKELAHLCSLLVKEELPLTWSGQFRCSDAMTPELFALMKKAGCTALSTGVESGSQRILNVMNKHLRLRTISRNLHGAAGSGMHVHVNLMVGFPGENIISFLQTCQFLLKHRGCIRSFSVLPCYVLPETMLDAQATELRLHVPEEGEWTARYNTYPRRVRLARLLNTFGKVVGLDDAGYEWENSVYTLARYYLQENLPERSFQIASSALGQDSDNPLLLYVTSEALHALGKREEADTMLERLDALLSQAEESS